MLNWIKKEKELFDHLNKWQMFIELFVTHSDTWNHLTVCKQINLDLFKNVINKMCLQLIYT